MSKFTVTGIDTSSNLVSVVIWAKAKHLAIREAKKLGIIRVRGVK